ncbi:MAG: GntR family transcriptional regulator [Pseudomonadota bacterium]
MAKPDNTNLPAGAAARTGESGALLGDVAYEAVLQAISNGVMKPGERIAEYKVAQWLNVSRTPAREALRRLENEGLLVSHPRRGLVVATVDSEAIFELYAAREILEGAAAGLAAQRASDAEIAMLKHMVEAEAEMFDDPARMHEHNLEFHALLYKAAHNRYLHKYLVATADTLKAHRAPSALEKEERRRAVLMEHKALVKAIASRNEEAARTAAANHVRAALRTSTRLHFQSMGDRKEEKKESPAAKSAKAVKAF